MSVTVPETAARSVPDVSPLHVVFIGEVPIDPSTSLVNPPITAAFAASLKILVSFGFVSVFPHLELFR